MSDSSRTRRSTPIGFDRVMEALRIQVHRKSAGRASREIGGTNNLSVPIVLGATTLMITNPTPIRELRIGLAGVNVLPFRADRDRTLNVKERAPSTRASRNSARNA